jgi:hypothetical protein
MDAAAPQRLSVTVNPTFRETFMASMALIRYQRWRILLHAVFPAIGVFILLFVASLEKREAADWGILVLVPVALGFTPLVSALTIWFSRRNSKLAQGPFTYSFDSGGMHFCGKMFEQKILWAALPRVRRTRRLIFIFIDPNRAFFIPLHSVPDPQFFEGMRALAGTQTDFGPGR